MNTHLDRRARRAQRRRIEAVAGTCVAMIVAAVVLASCDTATAGADPSRPRPLADRRVASVQHLPTTTTTTRPAVNPFIGPPPAASGGGRRVVYCNSCQTVWLVEADNYVTAMYKVSGHRGMPAPGEYHAFRKIDMGRSKAHPWLRLPWFVGFAWGHTTDIGFHGIPIRPDGSQIEDDSQLGIPLSSGCVRENQVNAKFLYDWASVGTLVVVTA